MARVFFHMRSKGKTDWVNEFRDFARVPVVGESIASDSNDATWYRVELVVHTPFPCDCEAEVYTIGENHLEVLKSSCSR